jgi:hypothetical protein
MSRPEIAVGDFVEVRYEWRKRFYGVVTEATGTDCAVCCTDRDHIFYLTIKRSPVKKVRKIDSF